MNPELLKQRRLILCCPYVHWYIGKTVASKVLGQMGSCKYQWIQKLIAKYHDNIYVYCDSRLTSMIHYHGDVLQGIADEDRRKETTLLEAKRWNELNEFKIASDHFINTPEQIASNDIVFTFSSHFLDIPITEEAKKTDLYKVFSRPDIFKVAHLTHYIFGMTHLAVNLKLFNINMLCYESNLAKYKFFKQYLPFVKNVSVIPFAIQDRFVSSKPFAQRVNKCIVTGGISTHKIRPDLMEFFFEYSSNNFYPLRVFITENAAELADIFYVKTGYYTDSMNDALKSSVSRITSWHELVSRPVEELVKIDEGKKISYYSEDIVSLYNNHMCSYVSDEIYHAPALGFFEAMACGTVPIGIDDSIYKDVGLVKNVNYLTFDGTLGGLLGVLVRVRNDPKSVAHIPAQNARLISSFSEDNVAKLFVQKLTTEYENWMRVGQRRVAVPA